MQLTNSGGMALLLYFLRESSMCFFLLGVQDNTLLNRINPIPVSVIRMLSAYLDNKKSQVIKMFVVSS